MARPPYLLASALGAALWLASTARAEDNHVTFQGRVEPERVAPGGKGTLVLVGRILPKVHVYADERLKIKTLAGKGVAYEKPELSKHLDWKNPDLGDEPPERVWFDKVEIRIPFTLAAEAVAPARVGATVSWHSCDDEQCFPPEKQSVEVAVARPEAAAASGAPMPGSAGEDPITASPPPSNGGGIPAKPEPDRKPKGPARSSRPALVLHGPNDATPAKHVFEDTVATVTVEAKPGEVTVVFAPKTGYHFYLGSDLPENDLSVAVRDGKGLEWQKVSVPSSLETQISHPVTFRAPYKGPESGSASGVVEVHWAGCSDQRCEPPVTKVVDLRVEDPSVATTPTPPPENPTPTDKAPEPADAASATTEGGLLFPVVGAEEKSWVQSKWETLGILILGPIFLIGLLLAFTPCVLPIIPITVSIIGGGRADLARSRLTILLVSYVLGLSCAFGSLGLVAAVSGASISAAFETPAALWTIASIFVLLGVGMFGIYELQPPAWLQRIQGQKKGGSIPAAFLFGALGAVIASPCTGPVIVGMLVFTAQGGNKLLGFLMFFTLGLGMGVVFFAAGALNFVMRPGPWMVWVRYVFGVMLVGVALYYLAHSGLISNTAVYAIGACVAAIIGVLIARHLVTKEGEPSGPAAQRGLKVASLLVLATIGVGLLTRPADAASFPPGVQAEPWITLRDRAHLLAEVQKAKGHPVVVDTTATWCPLCHGWEKLIASDPQLAKALSKMARLQIDVTSDPRLDLRGAIGAKRAQPFLVFLDAEGRVLRKLDIGDGPDKELLLSKLRPLGVLEE